MSISPKNKARLTKALLFISLVLIPWLLVMFYTVFNAHPRYVSQSQVVVKQMSDNSVGTGTGLIALLGGVSTSAEDANYLSDRILSYDMIKQLDPVFKFRQHYHVNGADFIYELPADASQEELLEYFKKRVHVELDSTTHILTVTTEGFTPEYALALNKAILQQSEQFVNAISQQTAREQVNFSERQLQDATASLNNAKRELVNYQNKNEILDPQVTAKALNSLISSLEANLSSLRTEERQLLSYLNPDAPQVVSLRSQIRAVEEQINQERAKLTSPTSTRLNTKAIQFEEIKAQVAYAEDKYKLALSALEKARYEASRKIKNLILITSPYQAQEALYPRRAYIISMALVFLLIFYGFILLVLAIIRDHKD